jgi:phosphoribosylglycinamide formyltransferase-1
MSAGGPPQERSIGEGLRTVVMISGGGTNLQAILHDIEKNDLRIRLESVISDRPDALGLERARDAGIETRVVDYAAFSERADAERELANVLESLDPELIVLAGFMRILPTEIVARFPGRMVNIHPSLLPKHRGLDTYRRALEAGDAWHGSTVHYVTPELDAGPAIIQYRVPIQANETEETLADRVRRGEYIVYPRAIGWIAEGRVELRGDRVWLDGQPLDAPVVVAES